MTVEVQIMTPGCKTKGITNLLGSILVSSQTKDYKIDICCFSAKHATFRSK